MKVELPIDHLGELWPAKLRGARVGALLHPASVSRTLVHSSRVLERWNGDLFKLAAFFGPQHGFLGQTQDNMIEWQGYEHPRLGIPIYSLYGEHREPPAEMLSGLDVLLVDLQDIGTRYYTFIWTLYLVMKACERAGVHVVVCERPNPINGVTTEGPVLNPAYRSFVGLHPLPVRHARTIGELARQFREEAFPGCELTVLPMRDWHRAMWLDDTGLPWVMPSPNMPTLATAAVYAGMCLLEGTNISEGRGTTRPFEIFGASFIDAEELARELNATGLPGVYFRENYFQPTFHKFARDLCGGAQLHVTDRAVFLPFETGLTIIRHIRARYPNYFQWKPPPYEYEYHRLPIEVLLGGPVADFFPD
ncbi:MAG: Protein YzbB [uncultured Chthoniobacterales bacterium]|uniref:Protein YzbB n=1 Tax=uncultured Chthoniobacterales bacterium TaxID=1836801 RepID=A0A6J4IYG3_9BACT|nr:MAG: Protein YzbB [uncultured Chthoniobacterales bacterium]